MTDSLTYRAAAERTGAAAETGTVVKTAGTAHIAETEAAGQVEETFGQAARTIGLPAKATGLTKESTGQAEETFGQAAGATGLPAKASGQAKESTGLPDTAVRQVFAVDSVAASQAAADSVAAAPAAGDSLSFPSEALSGSLFGTANSPHPETEPVLWRDTTAQGVFGRESTLLTAHGFTPSQPDSLTGNAVFQSFVLLLAATYALLLYRNLGDVTTLLGRISRETASGKRLSEDPGGSGFLRFLNIATTIGMLFMGVAAVKYGDSMMPPQLVEMLPHGAVLAMSLLATTACAAVAGFQLATVRLAGAVTLSQGFISQLILLKRTYFSLAVIVTSPALLLFALCPPGKGGVWFFVVAAELAITAILYLKEALNLFLSKKISILHWFLYLCTVEVFPISLLWLLAVR